MGIEYFELTPNGPARVAVEWVDSYRGVDVYFDHQNVATFPDRAAFQRGQMVTLPDGSRLAVRLHRVGIGSYQVQAALNGQKLKVTVRQRRRREAYQTILLIGVLTVLAAFYRDPNVSYSRSAEQIATTITIGIGVLFFGLAYMVRNRSQGALSVAILVYGLDGLLAVVNVLGGQRTSLVPIFAHIVLLVPLVRAYGKLGEDDWFAASTAFTAAPIKPPEKLKIDLQLDPPTPAAAPAPPAPENSAASEKLSLAVRLYQLGNNKQEAFKLVKEVLQERPKWAEAWYVVAYMVEKPEERQKALDRVIQIDPKHPGALTAQVNRNLGKAFMDELLVTTDASTPGASVSTLQQQAADAIKAGNPAQARLLVRRALTLDPNNADTWFVASYLATNAAVHREMLQQVLRLNPQHPMAQQAFDKLNTKDHLFTDLESATWRPRAG